MPRLVPAATAPGRGVATPGSGGSGGAAGRELPAERDVASRVARLAWPVIGEQLLLTLVGVVDIAMVGRLGASAVAGVGSATQLIQLAVSSMGAFSVGTTVLVAQATGARRPDEAAHVARQSLLAGLVAGVALAMVGAFAARPLIRLLGPEADVVETGALFLRLDALALPALVAMLVAGGALRGAGDTRTPLVASAAMNEINLVLAYVLVFGKLGLPAMGVAAIGKVALPVLALAPPLWAVGHVYAGSLRGAGDARFPMVATSAGMWLKRLPTAYLFGIVLGFGLPGVYLSSTFDAGLRALLNYLRHRSGRWQAIKI